MAYIGLQNKMHIAKHNYQSHGPNKSPNTTTPETLKNARPSTLHPKRKILNIPVL